MNHKVNMEMTQGKRLSGYGSESPEGESELIHHGNEGLKTSVVSYPLQALQPLLNFRTAAQ